MAIFHSYVKLPEDNPDIIQIYPRSSIQDELGQGHHRNQATIRGTSTTVRYKDETTRLVKHFKLLGCTSYGGGVPTMGVPSFLETTNCV